MLKEWAVKEGIDLDAIDTEEIEKEEQLKNDVTNAKLNVNNGQARQFLNGLRVPIRL